MMKVLWFSDEPAPYRVEFWEKISKHTNTFVIFINKSSPERSSKWYNYDFNFKKEYISENKGFLKKISMINRVFTDTKPQLFVSDGYSNLYNIYLMLLCKMNKVPIIISADGGIIDNSNKYFKPIISLIFKLSTRVLSSGIETDKYFKYFGVTDDKIVHYNFSSLSDKDIMENRELRDKNKRINKIPILLTVGSIIPRKGLDILLKSISSIEQPLMLTIVGGKGNDELLKLTSSQKHQVSFVEHVNKDILRNYYCEADIFVLPTRKDIWGLVINEAASFGLPIISSDNCVAAKEFISQIPCGLLFKNEDFIDLSKKITEMLNADLSGYSNASYKISKEYTIEKMIEKHLELFETMLGDTLE